MKHFVLAALDGGREKLKSIAYTRLRHDYMAIIMTTEHQRTRRLVGGYIVPYVFYMQL